MINFDIKASFTHTVNVNVFRTITVMLTGGTFDLFDRHCDGQNGYTPIAHQRNVCDGVVWCERALRLHWAEF